MDEIAIGDDEQFDLADVELGVVHLEQVDQTGVLEVTERVAQHLGSLDTRHTGDRRHHPWHDLGEPGTEHVHRHDLLARLDAHHGRHPLRLLGVGDGWVDAQLGEQRTC